MTDEYGFPEVHAMTREDGSVRVAWSVESLVRAVARHCGNTFGQGEMFVYLDVGRWGGDQRQFGVVFGDGSVTSVLLCAWHEEGGQRRIQFPPTPVRGFLGDPGLRGKVEVLSFFQGPLPVDTRGTIYVLLGDLHLPLIDARTPASEVAEVPERLVGSAWNRMDRALPSELLDVARGTGFSLSDAVTETPTEMTTGRWRELYLRGDIFLDAGPSLEHFLSALQAHCETPVAARAPIHLVQLGDMYEHWIGLLRGFRDFPDAVRPIPPAADRLRQVRTWVARTDRTARLPGSGGRTVSLCDRLHGCRVDERTFLCGNHDNYLRMLASDPAPTDPPRHRRGFLLENRLRAEHGHAADEYNRDGATRGHLITQYVFLRRAIREFDVDRRRTFVAYAAERFGELRGSSDEFRVFAMAHTHLPWLAPVVVHGRPARR